MGTYKLRHVAYISFLKLIKYKIFVLIYIVKFEYIFFYTFGDK